MSKQTVPHESDSVGVNVSVFVLHHRALVLFLCDSSGVAPSLRCCQPNNISSSSLKNNRFCVYVRLISFVVPSPPSSPIQSLISSFIGKRWDESFIFSLVMLFCYYTAVGLGEIAKNIIVVIFRVLTLFDIFLEIYVFALKSGLRTHSLHQKVIGTN